ncbi:MULTISPECIES: hypothetical protein [unclassified Ruminococcus]|uniref:hypothetical protein n=1 Tax=unclassified Ruminococcus TaxID=2608920 RepID=UPI001113D9E7|nr:MULTISPECIES: hypothetical protein [unclassified Ruminococcus]
MAESEVDIMQTDSFMSEIIEEGKRTHENGGELNCKVFSGCYLCELPVLSAESLLLKGVDDWMSYDHAREYINKNGLKASDVQMVSVKCVDSDGDAYKVDMSPEALYIISERNKHETIARAYALNAYQRKSIAAEISQRQGVDLSISNQQGYRR